MATPFSTPAWKIPRTEKPARWVKVHGVTKGHDWECVHTHTHTHTHTYTGNQWKTVIVPGKNASRPKMISFMEVIMQIDGHFKAIQPCKGLAEKGESRWIQKFLIIQVHSNANLNINVKTHYNYYVTPYPQISSSLTFIMLRIRVVESWLENKGWPSAIRPWRFSLPSPLHLAHSISLISWTTERRQPQAHLSSKTTSRVQTSSSQPRNRQEKTDSALTTSRTHFRVYYLC